MKYFSKLAVEPTFFCHFFCNYPIYRSKYYNIFVIFNI